MRKLTSSEFVQDTNSKSNTKARLSLKRKRESMKDSFNTCFYCYYLLIFFDDTIKIILNRNPKQGSKPDDYPRNFTCSSI